jgi:cytochrome c6
MPLKRLLLILLSLMIIVSLVLTPAALAASSVAPLATSTTDGAQLFEQNCAGCHINGGNIVRRGQTLKLKALQRNHIDTPEAIATLVTQGKGNMSAYGDRLSPAEIKVVSEFVLSQAQQGWH